MKSINESLLRLLLLLFVFAGSAGATIIQISSNAQTAAVGQSVNITVDVASVVDLYAYQFDLLFDPSVLQVKSLSEGSYLVSGGPTIFIPGTVDNGGGLVSATAAVLESAAGVSGSGVLVMFDFTAIAAGSTNINLDNVVLLDSGLSGIAATISNGSVAISAVPEPLYTPLVCLLVVGLVFFVAPRRGGRV
jgi:hypothetical protein